MIKNLLYSIFVHFILFSAIYFGFLKDEKKPIETDQEILVSVLSIDSKGIPPINEIIKKPDEEPKTESKIEPKKDEPKTKTKPENNKKTKSTNSQNISKQNNTPNKIPEKTPEKISKKDDDSNLKSNKKPSEINPPLPQNKDTEDSKVTTLDNKKTSPKKDNKNNNNDFFKVLNLKAFKNINEDEQGSNLSARETINIQSQLKMCYKRAIEESGFESRAKIIIKILISREGYIEDNLDEIIDMEKYNDPSFKEYKIIIDNIKRALELCSPLRNLPIEKYESWKEIILQFDLNNNAKND
ncbi:MAG: hypothetical protein FJX30_00650 [Alphaproteobacteria bacterium]|nr:hypothetical protein [Alphaproteobacteria bacterium]